MLQQYSMKQEWLETGGHLGRTNNLTPFQTDILKNFSANDSDGETFWGSVPKLPHFSERFFRLWKPMFTSTVFPIVPSV
jgi:hypothetical protein